MSTIGDVAKRAGVSRMTVSRVINNSGYISAPTRARVEAAIAELGYVPNALARGLRFKQTKTLALVLTDITNPFFTTVARGVEDTASQHGFSVMFCNTDEAPDDEAHYLTVLLQKQVDGVLLVPAICSSESVSFLQKKSIPFVVLDRLIPDCAVDTVRSDSEQGAYDLVQYLLGLGHRRIAILSGPAEITTACERVAGYLRALRSVGLAEDAAHIYHDAFTQEGGYRMAQEALQVDPMPTALFAGNNFIALGALRWLYESGLKVPEDVSIVAFDDMPADLVIDPFFTVMRQSAYEMGCQATQLLLVRLQSTESAEAQEIVLPTELVVRASAAAPSGTLSGSDHDLITGT